MTILVTGCAGFIGSHLCEVLLRQGHRVIGLDNMNPYYDPEVKQKNLMAIEKTADDAKKEFVFYMGDIRHQDQVGQILKRHEVTAIFHIAAMAGVRPSFQNPRLYVDVNEMGTLNLLEEARKNKVRHFIFASSSSVYGNGKAPFAESQPVDHPISVYAATKKAGELLCHTYHKAYDLSVACLRFFTVYGPRQRPDLAIHKFTKAIFNDETLHIYGDGSKSRDYTYIDDILDGLLKSYEWLQKSEEPCFDVFNLGESQTITVNQLIEVLEKQIGKTAQKHHKADATGDVNTTFANIEKTKKSLGYSPKVSIVEGIQKFVEWYQDTHPVKKDLKNVS